MKKSIITFVFTLISFFTLSAQVEFGGGAQLWLDPTSDFGLQARAKIGVGEKVDLKTGLTYLFDLSGFVGDVDVQYRLVTIGETTVLSPMAGINFILKDNAGGVQLNLGANLDMYISDRKYYFAPKFIIDETTGFVISAGTYF